MNVGEQEACVKGEGFVNGDLYIPYINFLSSFIVDFSTLLFRWAGCFLVALDTGWTKLSKHVSFVGGFSVFSCYCPKRSRGDQQQFHLVPRAVQLRYSSYLSEISSTRSPDISNPPPHSFLVSGDFFPWRDVAQLGGSCRSPNDITLTSQNSSTQLLRDILSVSAMFWLQVLFFFFWE